MLSCEHSFELRLDSRFVILDLTSFALPLFNVRFNQSREVGSVELKALIVGGLVLAKGSVLKLTLFLDLLFQVINNRLDSLDLFIYMISELTCLRDLILGVFENATDHEIIFYVDFVYFLITHLKDLVELIVAIGDEVVQRDLLIFDFFYHVFAAKVLL